MIKLYIKFIVQLTLLILLLCTNLYAQQEEQRLDLEGTSIIGNKELPKVLYIVPWKQVEKIDISVPAINSILDQQLKPIDRQTFRRQVKYHQQIFPESAKSP